MNVNAKAYIPSVNTNENSASKEVKTSFTQKISKEESIEIRAQITQNAKEMMLKSTSVQVSSSKTSSFENLYDDFQSFLNDVGYSGKAIAELSQAEASELVSEDGIFGIAQTSQRIAEFVINGAGGDEDRFRAGREGMLQGFKEAEAMWGEELPQISQDTMQAALEMVDKAMHDAGFSVLNTEA